MVEHTPTPWRTNEPHHSNYALEIVATNTRGNEELVCRPPGKRREANAAFIVKAVNAHDELTADVERLEQNARVQAKLLADTGRQRDALGKMLQIARLMIAGEIIEHAVIDTQTGQSLGDAIDAALNAVVGGVGT